MTVPQIIMKVVWVGVAYSAAATSENTIARGLGLAYLIAFGAILFVVGLVSGFLVWQTLAGAVMLGLAAHAFFANR
jgi:hypothetical protein